MHCIKLNVIYFEYIWKLVSYIALVDLDKFVYTKHALEQMEARDISKEVVEFVLKIGSIIDDKGHEQKIFQTIVTFSLKLYLVKVFVNASSEPFKIKTVYTTSKEKELLKYYGD